MSSVGPLCLIFLCLFGPLPSSFAMLPNRTRNSSPTVASAPALVSGTLASASISPEFLVLVIQANQTPISATVQQWLSAAVGAPSISMQSLPAISVQGCRSHLWSITRHIWTPLACTNLGLQPLPRHLSHQPLLGPCPFDHFHFSTSGLAVKHFARYVLISCFPPFVSVFSFASLPFSAPSSSTVYSLPRLPTTVNSAFALRPNVSQTVVPSLAALPLQQPFVVSPGYSPVACKGVSQITSGKFVYLEDLLAENIPPNTEERTVRRVNGPL